jgi:hypothetical protein
MEKRQGGFAAYGYRFNPAPALGSRRPQGDLADFAAPFFDRNFNHWHLSFSFQFSVFQFSVN